MRIYVPMRFESRSPKSGQQEQEKKIFIPKRIRTNYLLYPNNLCFLTTAPIAQQNAGTINQFRHKHGYLRPAISRRFSLPA